MTDIPVTLGAINVKAADPRALGSFWAAVTGGRPSEYQGQVYVAPGEGGFAMFFQPLTEPRGPHQVMHLDLTVAWGTRQETVRRLVALGATFQWDVLEEYEHVRWTTLCDPEGNYFCVAEHPPA